MLEGIKRKYPSFDLEGELKNLQMTPFRVSTGVQHRLELGGSEAGRSVVKTAMAACFDAGIAPDRCEIGAHTLSSLNDDRGFALFYIRDVVIHRPSTSLFHLVALRGDSKTGDLVAYVEYFGVMRMMVRLSSQYKGDSFKSVLAVDPVSGKRLDLLVNWDIPTEELQAAFSGYGVVRENLDFACASAIAIADSVREKRERRHMHREEVLLTLSQLGLQLGDIPAPQHRERFNMLMEEKLGSLSDLLKNLPSMPEE